MVSKNCSSGYRAVTVDADAAPLQDISQEKG